MREIIPKSRQNEHALQATVDKLTTPVDTINVPRGQHFQGSDDDAHGWGVPMVVKYLNEVLELPRYEGDFKRCEINGQRFLALEKGKMGSLNITQSLHALKIAEHAKILRGKVFEKAYYSLPLMLKDYQPIHVASLLHKNFASPRVAVEVLRSNLNGHDILTLPDDEIVQKIGGLGTDEAVVAMKALKQLVADNASIKQSVDKRVGSDIDDLTRETKEPKHGRKQTAMQRRRAASNPSSDTNTASTEELELEIAQKHAKRSSEQTTTAPSEVSSHAAIESTSAAKAELSTISSAATINTPLPSAKNELLDKSVTFASEHYVSDVLAGAVGHIAAETHKAEHAHDIEPAADAPIASLKDLIASAKQQRRLEIDHDPESAHADLERPSQHAKKWRTAVNVASAVSAFETPIRPKANDQSTGLSTEQRQPRLRPESAFDVQQHATALESPKRSNAVDKPNQSYLGNLERGYFVDRLNKLRRSVEENEQSMQYLRTHSETLRRDREREVVQNLIRDRDLAMQELERITRLYQRSSEQEQDFLIDDIRMLEQLPLSKNNHHEDSSQPLNQTYPRRSRADLLNLTRDRTLHRTEPFNRQDDDELSDLHDPSIDGVGSNGSGRMPQYVANIHDTDPDAPDVRLRYGRTGSQSRQPAYRLNASAVNPTTLPAEFYTGASPVKYAAAAILDPAIGRGTGPSTGHGLQGVDITNTVHDTAAHELDVWRAIIERYTVAAVAVDASAVEDTKLLLRQVALVWLRVGFRMGHDAYSESLDPEISKRLRGLERCCATMNLGDDRAVGTLTSNQRDITNREGSDNDVQDLELSLSQNRYKRHVHQKHTSRRDRSRIKRNRYSTATCMVFALMLVELIVEQASADTGASTLKERNNTLFLLDKAGQGELPMNEVSREGLRAFLDVVLGVEIPQWEKFDALCQRIDRDRNGFISVSNLVVAFINLSPLLSRAYFTHQPIFDLSTGNNRSFVQTKNIVFTSGTIANKDTRVNSNFVRETAQFTTLMLLSLVIDGICDNNLDLNAFWLKLLTAPGAPVSFTKYLEQHQRSTDSYDYTMRHFETGVARKLATDKRIVEEHQFVRDVMLNLTSSFVAEFKELVDVDPKDVPDSKSARVIRRIKSNLQDCGCTPLTELLLQHYAKNVEEVAKSLLLFNEEPDQLLNCFTTFAITFLAFRRRCLKIMLQKLSDYGTHKHKHSTQQSNKEIFQQENVLLECIKHLENRLAVLVGSVRAAAALSNSDNISDAEFDRLMSELMGCHIPAGGNHCLLDTQCVVETVLYRCKSHLYYAQTFHALKANKQDEHLHKTFQNDPTLQSAAAVADPVSQNCFYNIPILDEFDENVQSLRSLQLSHRPDRSPPAQKATPKYMNPDLMSTVYTELWRNPKLHLQRAFDDDYISPDNSPERPHRSGHYADKFAEMIEQSRLQLYDNFNRVSHVVPHVVDETNHRMHEQRVELMEQYLGVLNDKAVVKKKTLRALLELWSAAKLHLHKKGYQLQSDDSLQFQRKHATTVDEIVRQTYELQRLLIHEMQERADVRTEQLSIRVNKLRDAINTKSIPDSVNSFTDNVDSSTRSPGKRRSKHFTSLSAVLSEIGVVEECLLQANADCFQLIERILNHILPS